MMIKHIPITHNISKLIPQASSYLKARKDILFAYLFGSLTSGILKPLSDIDIAVYLKKGLKLSAILRIFSKRTVCFTMAFIHAMGAFCFGNTSGFQET